jgi:polyisoprenoid-binding protein YceI
VTELNKKENYMTLRILKPLAGVFVLALLSACNPKEAPVKNEAAEAVTQNTAANPPAANPSAAAEPAAEAAAATPAGLLRYEAQSTGSKMSIEGTSTLHNWTMDSSMVGGYLEIDPKFPESALTDAKAARPVVSVFMPVRSFKSGKSSMDLRMQKEMKEAQHKKIEYKLIELKPTSAAGATGALKFDATGAMTVAGKTLTNTIPVTIERLADGKLKIAGSTALKMSEYGIPPPTTIGLFETGDEVKLKFEWLTALKADAPQAQ